MGFPFQVHVQFVRLPTTHFMSLITPYQANRLRLNFALLDVETQLLVKRYDLGVIRRNTDPYALARATILQRDISDALNKAVDKTTPPPVTLPLL